MPIDADFLKLSTIIQTTENVPTSDQRLREWSGSWDSGYQILYSYLYPIVEQFQIVRVLTIFNSEQYNHTGTVCDSALTLCSTAPDNYARITPGNARISIHHHSTDKIFTDMNALRQDPDKEGLRNQVRNEVNDRLGTVQTLSDQAKPWNDALRSYTRTELRDMLDDRDEADDFQDDLDALDRVKGLVEGFSMDDMQDSLQEVEKMSDAGGTRALMTTFLQVW
ncbi:hypothetical protein BO71DRAFT_436850 [Aspergillus ellipticus CBS 707.79]|uniref:Uncharacterized protein n=1 Tax=Aspergillus ellipticus CBS 707.79 TaxID=1448320 RepID=A0A319F4N4_9EURO|nr:hypothetical protein BO71DRAFT_436850 [Aspergillus ellipticus CBS 707.79]